MEGFQAIENTSVERKGKEIRQEIREANSRGMGEVFSNVMFLQLSK